MVGKGSGLSFGKLLSMAISLSLILSRRGSLPFSGVIRTVLFSKSKSIHFNCHASPHLAPVSESRLLQRLLETSHSSEEIVVPFFSQSSFSGLSTALRCYLHEVLVYGLVLEFLALISWVFSILSLIAHSMNC